MSTFMDVEIRCMQAQLKNFITSCEMKAIQNDGIIDKKEKKMLEKLKTVTEKYSKELSKLE